MELIGLQVNTAQSFGRQDSFPQQRIDQSRNFGRRMQPFSKADLDRWSHCLPPEFVSRTHQLIRTGSNRKGGNSRRSWIEASGQHF
jgi:hypothetical protein